MITIRNASGTVLTHFDNNVPEGNPYFEPEMTENMESLVSSFSFSVPLQLEGSEYLSKLNQVLAKDKDGDLRVFVINDVYEDWNTTDGVVRVVAEDISISEMNGIILPPITAMNFNDALKAVFNKSGWTYELTANPSELDRAMYATEDFMNMREALVKLRTVYGCQFKFMAQEDAFGTIKRVVKIFKNRGNNTGKYFYYDRDLLNIERDINYNSIYTAVYATYKDEAGKSHNLINWLPNYPIEGFTKDYASPLIVNDSAHLEWDEPTVYRTMLHKSDLHDPNQVFQEAVDALGKADEPIYTYKMNMLLLQNMIGWEGEDVNLGDTVWAKERVGDRELGLEARVVEYVYHEDDPTLDTVTFSNYVEIDTTDAKELSNRIYFAYANSADGTKDFSTTDSVDKLYMGVYTSDVDVQSTDPSVYSWTRIRGEDGNSAPVLNLSATSMIMKFKADNTPDGDQTITFQATVMYMAEDSVTWQATPYIGNAAQPDITLTGTGLSRTLKSSEWNTNWTRLVVRVSANGLADIVTITRVADGANGEAGEAVIGFLTNEAVTFAANSAGVVSDYSIGNGQFILYEGLRQVTSGVIYAVQSSSGITPSINTTTGEYVVDKMTANMAQVIFTASYKGVTITKSMSLSKSIAGQNGQDGQNGVDGQTIWTAYANSADGKTNFSLTDSDRAYIGTSSGKASDTQPTDPTKYRWSRIKGSDATSFSMSGDSNVMKFDANGEIKAGQLITFTAIKKVLVDNIYWEATPYIENIEQPKITLGGTSETTRTLAASQWGYGITSIKVKAECGDFEDAFTVVKLQDGPKGQDGTNGRDSITGILTNEAQQLSASSTGVVNDYKVAKGTFQLYDGTTLVTSDVNFEVDDLDGGDASINSTTGFYAVTNVTKDVTNFMFKVTYKGVTIRKTFCVSKSKQGVQGVQGVQGLMGIAFYSPTPPTGQGVEEGATWFKTVSDTDDTILSINKFKDGNWVETSLASGTLAIKNLAAISADLGNVTAGTITGVTINSAVFNSPFDTYTTEASARRITGTSTLAQGRLRSQINFPNAPVETRGTATFTVGPDSVVYDEKNATNRTVGLIRVNQQGLSIREYLDSANPSQPTNLCDVNLRGLSTQYKNADGTGSATLVNLYLKSQLLTDSLRVQYGASNGEIYSEQATPKVLGTYLPDFSTPAENINFNDVSFLRKISYSATQGLKGRNVQNISGAGAIDRTWNIIPQSLEQMQTANQFYTIGNSDGQNSWVPATDGITLQLPPYYHQSVGFMDTVQNLFSMASDRKTIRLTNLPNYYRDFGKRLHWRVTMWGKNQLSRAPKNTYTYLSLRQNGNVITEARTIWSQGMGWQQSVAAPPAMIAMNVGDDFSVVLGTNLAGAANYTGGAFRIMWEPVLVDNRGNLV